MIEQILAGETLYSIIGSNQAFVITELYPYKADNSETTLQDLQELLEKEQIKYGINLGLLDFYLKKARAEQRVLKNLLVSSTLPALKRGQDIIRFSFDTPLNMFSNPEWEAIAAYFNEPDEKQYVSFPFPVKFLRKGETIGKLEEISEDKDGTDIFGNAFLPGRGNILEVKTGDGVLYDFALKSFIAAQAGYLVLKNHTINVYTPFYITDDKMKLYYLNLPKLASDSHPSQEDLTAFLNETNVKSQFIVPNPLQNIKDGEHKLLAKGTTPKHGTDATVSFLFSLDKSIGKEDAKGRIDFKERDFFLSVTEGQVLATKTLPQEGMAGMDIFEQVIPSLPPKDVIIKCGPGTRWSEGESEVKIVADIEGILEYKNNMISVFPNAIIKGDVDLKSGNIRTKTNVEITGNILAGFEVISDKNITINGNIEDMCHIKAKGDILVKGGILGEQTKVICEGNLIAKYINCGYVYVKGNVTVERFILGSEIICLDSINVLGRQVNLAERGAIVDCDIKVRNSLIAPVVGSDAGLTTTVAFGYDASLEQKIQNLKETLAKITQSIEEIKAGFDVDITLNNLFTLIRDYAKPVKDEILAAVDEIEKFRKKYDMMEKILLRELTEQEELLKETYVKISQKVFPPLILHAHQTQKPFNEIFGPSKFYFDYPARMIRRTQFVGTEDGQTPERGTVSASFLRE